MKTGPIPGFKQLIRNLVIAEVILSLLFFSLDRYVDLEAIYNTTRLSVYIEINLLVVIVIVFLEVMAVTLVIYRWLRNSNLQAPPADIKEILKTNEHQNLECKQTLRWDLRENKINRAIEKSALKTIAALANNNGGYLVIGVADNGEVIGLDQDFQTLKKKNRDGFEVLLNRLITDYLGLTARTCCQIQFEKIKDKEVCLVTVKPSNKPIYYKDNNMEEFFVRTGNNTTSLSISQANQYINEHFKIFQSIN